MEDLIQKFEWKMAANGIRMHVEYCTRFWPEELHFYVEMEDDDKLFNWLSGYEEYIDALGWKRQGDFSTTPDGTQFIIIYQRRFGKCVEDLLAALL